jgi:hypothetical protein
VTVTPGTTAPVESTTVPRSAPVVADCAHKQEEALTKAPIIAHVANSSAIGNIAFHVEVFFIGESQWAETIAHFHFSSLLETPLNLSPGGNEKPAAIREGASVFLRTESTIERRYFSWTLNPNMKAAPHAFVSWQVFCSSKEGG